MFVTYYEIRTDDRVRGAEEGNPFVIPVVQKSNRLVGDWEGLAGMGMFKESIPTGQIA
jgi:hypothetical protein